MSDYIIKDTTMSGLADGIRALNGVAGAITPAQIQAAAADAKAEAEAQMALISQLREILSTKGIKVDHTLEDAIVTGTLTTFTDHTITAIGENAFRGFASLKTVDAPNVISVGGRAFTQSGITRLEFPKLTSASRDACTYCYSLTYADFGNVSSIPSWCVAHCTAFQTLILRKTDKICTLAAINALTGTLIESGTGYIYVPAALVDSYKAATNWSTFAAQFRAIEDYPDITGG